MIVLFNEVIVAVQSLTHILLRVTPWTATHQASLSFSISQSLFKLISIESVVPSNHLILCHSFFLLPSFFPSIKVFSNELVLRIRWPKYNGITGYQSGKCHTWIVNLKNQASKMQRVGARYPRNNQWKKSKRIHVVIDYTSM